MTNMQKYEIMFNDIKQNSDFLIRFS